MIDNEIKLIKENNKYNYIKPNGELLSSVWFAYAKNFCCECGLVYKNCKFNFINKDGKLISDIWFSNAENFIPYIDDDNNKYRFGGVVINGEWYNIDYQGNVYYMNKNNVDYLSVDINYWVPNSKRVEAINK